MEWIFTIAEIKKTATELWKYLAKDRVLAVHGSMGSGKTTFIHALCEMKAVQSVVSSPTFSIINEYIYKEGGQEERIFHIDLYRLKGEEEARLAGVEDCLFSGSICLVEWPERAPGLFPAASLHVYLHVLDEETRRLQIGNN